MEKKEQDGIFLVLLLYGYYKETVVLVECIMLHGSLMSGNIRLYSGTWLSFIVFSD